MGEELYSTYPILGAFVLGATIVGGFMLAQLKYYRDKLKDKEDYIQARNEVLINVYGKSEKLWTEVTFTMQQLGRDQERSDTEIHKKIDTSMMAIVNHVGEIKSILGDLKNAQHNRK